MTDDPSEYGRLLAARDRLIGEGVDAADLETPLPPPSGRAAVSEAEGALARAYQRVWEKAGRPSGWQPNLTSAILAALCADGWRVEREGLDVERLARAEAMPRKWDEMTPASRDSTLEWARRTAAEYAALGGPDATD